MLTWDFDNWGDIYPCICLCGGMYVCMHVYTHTHTHSGGIWEISVPSASFCCELKLL